MSIVKLTPEQISLLECGDAVYTDGKTILHQPAYFTKHDDSGNWNMLRLDEVVEEGIRPLVIVVLHLHYELSGVEVKVCRDAVNRLYYAYKGKIYSHFATMDKGLELLVTLQIVDKF